MYFYPIIAENRKRNKIKTCKSCIYCEKAPNNPNYKNAFGWCKYPLPFFLNTQPLIYKKEFKPCSVYKNINS